MRTKSHVIWSKIKVLPAYQTFVTQSQSKKISYGEDRRNYSKFVLSQIFRIRQATKRGEDSLEQKKFTTCKKLRLNFDLQSWLEILKFFLGAIFAIFSLASVFCRRASSKMSNHQSSYSANQNSSACRS